ncbi:MAG: cyclic nucleotide-binding domain-containing protein [Candidatus Tectomicrobia bacterium]|uniref:Cyclic nucleotide-binding domain-containing protein n=1 Tax=Tectimicrobiota bacterium TaxID=2528274 RepID=A0A932FW36_UNCTE|nr:cyclic nucleotide-binding domain-containing protein [Candidatus Tectomicrobia bacterium]
MNIAVKETYQDGQLIFQEGSFGEGTYVILSGKVKILKKVNNANVTVATLEKGDIFGELSFIDQGPRSASAVAVGDVQVGLLDKDILEDEVNKMSSDFRIVMKALTKRLRETTSQLVNLTKEYHKLKGTIKQS